MHNSIEKQILAKMKKAGRGRLFFIENFQKFGNSASIRKGLERLVKADEIIRAATGVYLFPKIDSIAGVVMPTVEEIAKAIARKERAKVIPTGIYALNKLGLSTQVPLKIVFYTSGSSRKIKVSNQMITFKKAAPKNFAMIGPKSSILIQALKTIGQQKISEMEKERIKKILASESAYKLSHDLKLAPEWIRKLIKELMKGEEYGNKGVGKLEQIK